MTVPEKGWRWRRSTFSSQGGDCVEFGECAEIGPGFVAIRDSKNPDGPALHGVNIRSLIAMVKTLG